MPNDKRAGVIRAALCALCMVHGALMASGCAKTQAASVPDGPPLAVPAAPPRVLAPPADEPLAENPPDGPEERVAAGALLAGEEDQRPVNFASAMLNDVGEKVEHERTVRWVGEQPLQMPQPDFDPALVHDLRRLDSTRRPQIDGG